MAITVLNVGQADAIFIRAPEGQTALVDAGSDEPLRYLIQAGVERLDLLVASHAHEDHIGGMSTILDALPVGFFLDNGAPYSTSIYSDLIATLAAHPEIAYLAGEPRHLELGTVDLEVLPTVPGNDVGQNDLSVALVLRFGEFVAFLSGDSERRQLDFLTERELVPRATVLKAAHHGSDDGFTTAFLTDVQPEVVVISVGEGNGYGHPGVNALSAYRLVADTVLRTDRDGHVTIHGYADGTYDLID